MIGFQNQIAGGEQDLFHFRILMRPSHASPRRSAGNALPVLAAVFKSFACERYPGDAHLFHILIGKRPGVFRCKAGEVADFLARELPLQTRKLCARVRGPSGYFIICQKPSRLA